MYGYVLCYVPVLHVVVVNAVCAMLAYVVCNVAMLLAMWMVICYVLCGCILWSLAAWNSAVAFGVMDVNCMLCSQM